MKLSIDRKSLASYCSPPLGRLEYYYRGPVAQPGRAADF